MDIAEFSQEEAESDENQKPEECFSGEVSHVSHVLLELSALEMVGSPKSRNISPPYCFVLMNRVRLCIFLGRVCVTLAGVQWCDLGSL